REVVARQIRGLSTAKQEKIGDETFGLERVRVVEVQAGRIVELIGVQRSVVAVVVDQQRAVAERAHERPGERRLSRRGPAGDADDDGLHSDSFRSTTTSADSRAPTRTSSHGVTSRPRTTAVSSSVARSNASNT